MSSVALLLILQLHFETKYFFSFFTVLRSFLAHLYHTGHRQMHLCVNIEFRLQSSTWIYQRATGPSCITPVILTFKLIATESAFYVCLCVDGAISWLMWSTLNGLGSNRRQVHLSFSTLVYLYHTQCKCCWLSLWVFYVHLWCQC